jgi:hypothetical protein
MNSKSEITPAQAFGILIERIDKRKSVLERMGDQMPYRIAHVELDIVRHQLVRAQQYFVKTYSETTVRFRK